MTYVFFCVLLNVGIFLCFKLFKQYNLNTFQAIVFNYITCVVTGVVFIGGTKPFTPQLLSNEWFIIAIILGAIFIVTFYVMALTTQKFSMTVSSIASKMSLIIPMLVSLFVLDIQVKSYSVFNYLGMILAVVSIVMSSYKPSKINEKRKVGWIIVLPLIVFLAGGIIDSTLNYTNHKYLTAADEAIFPILTFMSAAVIGSVSLIISKSKLAFKNVIGGFVLGVVNYFSIFFLIKGLTAFDNDGAIFYPLLNVGIIMIAAIVSVILFKEKLTIMNKLGLVLSLLAMFMISYQEIIAIING